MKLLLKPMTKYYLIRILFKSTKDKSKTISRMFYITTMPQRIWHSHSLNNGPTIRDAFLCTVQVRTLRSSSLGPIPSAKSKIRGRVQTTWTEFWVILTPSPYVDAFTK